MSAKKKNGGKKQSSNGWDPFPVALKRSRLHGRGVFATRDIKKGEVVERAPLIVLDADDWDLIAETKLGGYVYELDKRHSGMAGGLGAFYNHACPANAAYVADGKTKTVTIRAVRRIKAGDEVCINYNGDPDSADPVHFT